MRVRVCPVCRTECPEDVFACPRDGSDLLMEPIVLRADAPAAETVPPPCESASQEGATAAHLVLESIEVPGLKFVVREGQCVGRGEAADIVLAGSPHFGHISRRMAVFFCRGEQWFIQHVATSNYIKVDGCEYEDDTEVAIEDGSVVGLPLAMFRVKVSS